MTRNRIANQMDNSGGSSEAVRGADQLREHDTGAMHVL
jgi:hypothetical protein